jgi:hypothetical protein
LHAQVNAVLPRRRHAIEWCSVLSFCARPERHFCHAGTGSVGRALWDVVVAPLADAWPSFGALNGRAGDGACIGYIHLTNPRAVTLEG